MTSPSVPTTNGRAALIDLLQRKVARLETENESLRETIRQTRWAARRQKVTLEQAIGRAEVEKVQRDSLHALLNTEANHG